MTDTATADFHAIRARLAKVQQVGIPTYSIHVSYWATGMHPICPLLRNAPADIEALLDRIAALEAALREMRGLAQTIQDNEIAAMQLDNDDPRRGDLERVIGSNVQLLKNLAANSP